MIRRLFALIFANLRLTRRRTFATADASGSLMLAAPGPAAVDQARRTIEGLAVPFGPVGQTSAGRLTFATGALSWSDPSRVKLLREHSQADPVGFATTLEALDAAAVDARLLALGQAPAGVAGLWATFRVPEGPSGDQALAEAANGLRDGLSVGVQLDDATMTRMRRANGSAVAGAGALREISLVSVPAWDDARTANVAASAHLVVSAWTDPTPVGGTAMPCRHCGQNTHAAEACPTLATATATATSTSTAGVPSDGSAGAPPAPVVTAGAGGATTPPATPTSTPPATPAPDVVRAGAGAAIVTGEPATYTFSGGDSLVRDAFLARMNGDADGAGRLARFNAELAAGNPASVMALAAVLTRDATDQIGPFVPQGYRPDLMVRVIDAGRPIVSRLQRVPISNASPFLVPVEGDFTGVADHTEGTAHVPEGTLDVNEETVAPKAVSGAFRVSREMVDSSNPAIDRVAINAMARDYRQATEAKAVAAFAAAAGAAVPGINTVAELSAQLVDFMPDDDVPADFVAAGRTFFSTLRTDADSTGRPMIPYAGPSNAPGSIRRPAVLDVDGTDLFRASRVAAGEAFIVRADDVLWAESNVQQFRFDEVEGPGIIKLALWAYNVAQVLRASSVRRLASA
jgi:HK97 family phage prohead protease